MNVFTNSYKNSHGHGPRGKGNWVFKITFVPQGEHGYDTEFVQSNGMYSAAKRDVIQSFKSQSDVAEVVAVTVMP